MKHFSLFIALVLIGLAGLAACQRPGSATLPGEEIPVLPTDTLAPAQIPAETEPASPTKTLDEQPGLQTPQAEAGDPTSYLFPTAPEYPGNPLPADRGDLFSGSGACTSCHTKQEDEAGNDVSTDALWRATMLANAARDPYWLATVRSEVLDAPDLRDVIEQKCATCHMPMAEFSSTAKNSPSNLLDTGFTNPIHPLNGLAMDGVSCTLCHQLEPDQFGQEASYSGGFQVDLSLPTGERLAYGPFDADPALAAVMQSVSGFIPARGDHVGKAEMCASCHVLFTPYLDDEGQIAGEFPEQMTYLEWENSAFQDKKTCQDCHMPLAQGGVPLSITGGQPRSPFYQHFFVGGNAFMGRILQMNAQQLKTTASTEHFETMIQNASQQIETQTARLVLENLQLDGSRLNGQIVVTNLAGHKFPSGYPSRRAWLHITIVAADGTIAFESGSVQPDGAIQGNDQDETLDAYEPHHIVIQSTDQVQIYEAVMLDVNGKPTTHLLRGASYGKDNRLLPEGFVLSTAGDEIKVAGEAVQDGDFQPGSDRVDLDVDLTGVDGPFTLRIELCYQSIGYRWASNTAGLDAPETQAFQSLYESIPNWPLVAASLEAVVQP